MLHRIFIVGIALSLAALLPGGSVLALPDAPAQTAPVTIPGALLDQIAKSSASPNTNRQQGLGNFNLSFHDDRYQYTLPLCFDASLVEVDGRVIDPAVAFVKGDNLVVSIKPNSSASAKSCVSRVVRQKISRGASGGECLQDFQVKREIEGKPEKLLVKTDYAYTFSIYTRPTLDCDGKAYGAAPITTTVAAGKPFLITLARKTAEGEKELKRWSLTTDASGKANLNYTFAVASDEYHLKIAPGTASAPGDEITWTEKVIDPNASPSPAPAANSGSSQMSTLPIIILLGIILIVAGGAEYWHWTKSRRKHELPEDEYNRISKL